MLVLKIAAGFVLALTLAACTVEDEPSGSDDPAVVENSPESRPGSQAVYARIESSTNCVDLQREFDIAMANVEREQDRGVASGAPLSYANAANSRMQEVGCYG